MRRHGQLGVNTALIILVILKLVGSLFSVLILVLSFTYGKLGMPSLNVNLVVLAKP